MSDEEGGDALHDNVLIEGDADAEAQAEEDIDAAPATEARTAKEERRRRRKEKKRKSEAAEEEAAEQAEELVPEPLDADDELALQEVGLVEPVSAAAGDVETDGTKAKRRRAAKEEIRVADTEKQAAYLSRQLITKGGVEFALSAEHLIPLDASTDRSPGAIWTTLATEVPGFSDIASAGPQFKKKKHPEKESKKQRSEVPAAAGGVEQTAQGGEEGAPRLVVFAASAEAGEVLFKALTGGVKSPVARAYQRRQKVDSQLAFLKNPVAAIVGLPPRLHKLADLGALSFARCEYIVIDMSRNTKSFDFFDVKEVRESFAELFHAYLAPLVQEGKARIVLY